MNLSCHRLQKRWSLASLPVGLGLVLLFSVPARLQAANPRVVIMPAPGFEITWDGNNGGYSNPEPGAIGPDHPGSSANGAVPFGSSAFLPVRFFQISEAKATVMVARLSADTRVFLSM